jgi:hypothetical protein
VTRRVLVSAQLPEFKSDNSAFDRKLNDYLRENQSHIFENFRFILNHFPPQEISRAETLAGAHVLEPGYFRGDIRRYGAVSNGDIDGNTQAWQDACAQAATNEPDSAPVYIPHSPNGYEVNAGATVVSFPIRIYGDNAYNSFLRTSEDISILTLQDIQQLNGPVLENIGFTHDDSPSSSVALVRVKNSSNGRILGCQMLRGYYGVQFEATATAPFSCYSWAIEDSTIANCRLINIECESQTNHLTLRNVTFGAGAPGGLHIVDSYGLSIFGGDCEGCTTYAVDIDSTFDLAMGVVISGVDFETCAATVGVIRIGATDIVRNVTIIGNVFNNAGSSQYAINPENAYNVTAIGNSATTGFSSGYAVNPSGADTRDFVGINNTWQTRTIETVKGSLGYSDGTIAVAGFSGRHASARVAVTYSASMTPDAALGNHFEIVITDGVAFTINNPTNAASGSAAEGQEITLWLCNTSGGAHGAITLGANLKSAGALPAIATANNRSFKFKMRLGVWHEVSRSPADVAN